MTASALFVIGAGLLLPILFVVSMGVAYGPKAAVAAFVLFYGSSLLVIIEAARRAPVGREIPFVGFVQERGERGEADADFAASIAFILVVALIIVAPFIGWR